MPDLLTTITGTPYRMGDLLEIEGPDGWVEVRVVSIDYDQMARFGCHWYLAVTPTAHPHCRYGIHVNDDGRNYTITRRVRPSEKVEV